MVRCIFHKDDTPSLSINVDDGKFRCFAAHCPATRGGGFKAFDLLIGGAVPGVLAHAEPIAEEVVQGYHEILLNDSERLTWLEKKRGLTRATLEQFKIGWDSERFTIPIREGGTVVNIRKYKPGALNDKVINYGTGHGRPRLFPEPDPDGPIYLFEGEMDTLLGRQLGYPASTVTSGAGQWSEGINRLLQGREVWLCYDTDLAGRQGADRIGQIISQFGTCYIAELPLPGTKDLKDFTNLFHDRKIPIEQARKEFQEAIDGARKIEPLVSKTVRAPDEQAEEIHLSQIGLNSFVNKRIASTVLIAGKDLAPFQVPKCIAYNCEGGEKICGRCGIAKAGLALTKTFEEWSPELLEMVNVPVEKLESIISQAADVPFKCRKYSYEIKEHANVEAIKAIPEIDFASEDAEYVIRNLFYLGHGLESNKTYRIKAVVMPEPKTQYATALVYEAIPAQDSLEKFELDLDLLSIFKVE